MTWIVPKSLISRFAPATEELTSDCAAASQTCEQSLMRRSKPSRANSFLREWKAGNLMRLRSGLISSDSLGKSFEDWWTSCLAVIRASHSLAPASDSEEKTRDTSGRLSQAAFEFFNLESASLKTSRATLPKGSITSCLTWEDWVTEQHGEFSARVNAARLINGRESLSWPTATARDYKDCGENVNMEKIAAKFKLAGVVALNGPADPESSNLDGSRQELWPTATATNRVRNEMTMSKCAAFRKRNANQSTVPLYLEEKVRLEQTKSWATPEAKNQVGYQVGADGTKWPRLGSQVKDWGTPRAGIQAETHFTYDRGKHNIEEQAGAATPGGGKLNPRWVETLMGLPVGWTMPSCASPVTIELTNCGSLETESCQQLQNEHSLP